MENINLKNKKKSFSEDLNKIPIPCMYTEGVTGAGYSV